MSEIRKYVVVDADNEPVDGEEHEALLDATAEAAEYDGPTAVIARVYTYDDSELVWTSTGEDVWPPAHVHQWGPIQHGPFTGEPSRPCIDAGCGVVSLDLYLHCTACGAQINTTEPGVYFHVEPDDSHEPEPESGEAPDDEPEE